MQGKTNPVTPAGYAAMKARYDHLLGTERPEIVEIVSWAAGNGDRSENGDYLYGRKRMREIDRELAHLARRMKAARVIDPAEQPDKARAFFGATVTYCDDDDNERTVRIVGVDEARLEEGEVSWMSPIAKALMQRWVGDIVKLNTPQGVIEIEVLEIAYQDA